MDKFEELTLSNISSKFAKFEKLPNGILTINFMEMVGKVLKAWECDSNLCQVGYLSESYNSPRLQTPEDKAALRQQFKLLLGEKLELLLNLVVRIDASSVWADRNKRASSHYQVRDKYTETDFFLSNKDFLELKLVFLANSVVNAFYRDGESEPFTEELKARAENLNHQLPDLGLAKTPSASIDKAKEIVKKYQEKDEKGVLDSILSPLSSASFKNDYWAKQTLLVKGEKNKFEGLFSLEELSRVLQENKELFVRATYDRAETMIVVKDPTQASSHFEAGASICSDKIDLADAKLANLVKDIKRELKFSGEIGLRSYWSPPNDGFGLHFDANMTFSMQIEGRKKWRYSKKSHLHWPDYQIIVQRELNKKTPRDFRLPTEDEMEEVILEPGDVLVVPGGAWHEVCALDEDSLALTLSFDSMFGVTQYINDAIDKIISKSEALRSPPPIDVTSTLDVNGCPITVENYFRDSLSKIADELHEMSKGDIKNTQQTWLLGVLNSKRTECNQKIKTISVYESSFYRWQGANNCYGEMLCCEETPLKLTNPISGNSFVYQNETRPQVKILLEKSIFNLAQLKVEKEEVVSELKSLISFLLNENLIQQI